MSRLTMFGMLACVVAATGCASKGDTRSDSLRADTLVPAAQVEDTVSVTATSSTPPATPATKKPAARKAAGSRAPAARKSSGIIGRDSVIRMDPRNAIPMPGAIKPDSSNLGYDRAIRARRDSAHTLPRPSRP